MTSENQRYHAAGYLGGAALLASEHPQAARVLLNVVKAFTEHPTCATPPQLSEKLDAAIENPDGCTGDIILLEAWFVDPLNTLIEKSGGRFG